MLNYKLGKKGQVGETVSWIVATLVIVGILLIFIYFSTLIAKTKLIELRDFKFGSEEKIDLLSQKNSFAYNITNNKNKELIENILKENG
ncbi:hypothetical protein M0R19_00205 [Candidatus Pacearchaeota archaeon]|nr:hypothetical protein [Candidatus Pacearchaeota archaeon]